MPPVSSLERDRRRLAFSNIAWTPEEDEPAYALLSELGFSAIEVAPARLWSDPASATSGITPEGLRSRGLSISGFQAILFGKADLRLFDVETRPRLFDYLAALAQTCSRAGGSYLVFGAPKNRWIPPHMSEKEALEVAVSFFKSLSAILQDLGVVLGLEANPAIYGCNFCTDASAVIRLVHAVDSPGIKWHLDTGELAMNNEQIPAIVHDHARVISSVHISEPHLGDFSNPWSGHSIIARALRDVGFEGFVSLEMKRPSDGLEGVRRAAGFLRTHYA